jgi:hypothetical protein
LQRDGLNLVGSVRSASPDPAVENCANRRLLGMRGKMDYSGAIVFSSSDKRGHEKMFYSDVTNPRERSVKKLSVSLIV